eukprot:m51a1_g12329 hypothetical protein (311) ;mRNA; r:462405-463486
MVKRDRVLIVGPEDVCTTVARGVLTRNGGCDAGDTTAKSWALPLKTKYYSADVQLAMIPGHPFPQWTEELSSACDGLILCLSPDAVVDEMKWVCDSIGLSQGAIGGEGDGELPEEGPERARPAVILALASSPLFEDERVREWAFDVGAELIDPNATTSDARDKEGLDRVLEALQANMWEGAIKAEPKASAGNPEAATAADALSREFFEEDGFWTGSASLEDAVGRLRSLRDTARTLPDDQRRDLALRVALSLARAEEEEGVEGAPAGGDDGDDGDDDEFGFGGLVGEDDERLFQAFGAALGGRRPPAGRR